MAATPTAVIEAVPSAALPPTPTPLPPTAPAAAETKKKPFETNPCKIKLSRLFSTGLPPDILFQFDCVKLHEPYAIQTFGNKLLKSCIADKVIDFPLDWKKDVLQGKNAITTVKMHAIVCSNMSKEVGNIRIASLCEAADPTCTIWYFEKCKLQSIMWMNGDGTTCDTGRNKLPHHAATAAIEAIVEWLKKKPEPEPALKA